MDRRRSLSVILVRSPVLPRSCRCRGSSAGPGLQRTGRWNLVDQVDRSRAAGRSVDQVPVPPVQCTTCLQALPAAPAPGTGVAAPRRLGILGDAGGLQRTGRWYLADQADRCRAVTSMRPPAAPGARCRPYRHPGTGVAAQPAAGDPRRRRRLAGALLAGSGRSDRRVPRCCASAPGCSPAAPGALCRPRRRPGTRATGPVHDLLADALLTNYPRV